MKKVPLLIFLISTWVIPFTASYAAELPKVAVWDLTSGDIKAVHAQDLSLILASEIAKMKKYEVYSQENVRALAGWTAETMTIGCTVTECLTALGQMDIAKLISGSVGKIGSTFSISLNLFDSENAKAEKAVSEFCGIKDELIPLVQVAVRKLLGVQVATSKPEEKVPEKATAASLPEYGKSFEDPVTGMEFVFVKGGCFEMGDTFGDGDPDEKPVHEVCVDDFYLGKYEVTQEQWEIVTGNNPSRFKERDRPVEQVSWNDVQQFIRRLNDQSGRKFRLPTEAEWEYAARSGGRREKYAGTDQEGELGQYAWYVVNSGRITHPVGKKRPNGLGLYDMSGNVWEWCADRYGENYYQGSPKNNPEGPFNGSYRVLRGGSWFDDPGFMRAAFRYRFPSAIPGSLYGFRLGLSAR